MAFKDSLRLEQIYFQKLKDMIKTCKAWYDGENTDKDRDILEALIQACAAILLLYRNLGEEWNELTALIQRTMHDLVYLKEKTDVYHDELNEKIDEVNNYLNAAITIIEAQIDAFGGLPSNANAEVGDVLMVGENHINEWANVKNSIANAFRIVFDENKTNFYDEQTIFYSVNGEVVPASTKMTFETNYSLKEMRDLFVDKKPVIGYAAEPDEDEQNALIIYHLDGLHLTTDGYTDDPPYDEVIFECNFHRISTTENFRLVFDWYIDGDDEILEIIYRSQA